MSAKFLAITFMFLAIISPRVLHAGDVPIDLVANYSDGKFWLGIVDPNPDGKGQPITRIYRRESGGGQLWRPFTSVSARLQSIAPHGEQLAVLLDNGDWMLVWPSGQSSGARLPAGKILALQGDGSALWALGQVPGAASVEKPPATRPATGPMRLVLLTLERSKWVSVGELPEPLQIDGDQPSVALAIVDHVPVVAVQNSEKSIVGARFSSGKIWTQIFHIPSPSSVSDFDLLPSPRGVLAWVAGSAGAGALTWVDPANIELKLLASSRVISASARRVMVIASERLRLIFNEGDQIYEQKFDLNGTSIGDAAALKLPIAIVASPLISYFHRVVMVALMFTIIAAIRQRPQIQETIDAAKKLPLAGFGVRFLAGLVDALPVIVTTFIVLNRAGADSMENMQDATTFVPILISIAVYIIHITVGELVGGRSIGKIIFALRVVDLRGQKPTPGAIVLRNILRIIDLYGLFALILVLYSPLRQRAGDVAAGTMVVSESPVSEDLEGKA